VKNRTVCLADVEGIVVGGRRVREKKPNRIVPKRRPIISRRKTDETVFVGPRESTTYIQSCTINMHIV